MLQFAVWTRLAELGLGASLQHYNPIVDQPVRAEFGLPKSWRLIAQMPFGSVVEPPGEKKIQPVEERMLVFGK